MPLLLELAKLLLVFCDYLHLWTAIGVWVNLTAAHCPPSTRAIHQVVSLLSFGRHANLGQLSQKLERAEMGTAFIAQLSWFRAKRG